MEENEFELFLKENFSKVPAIYESEQKEYLSSTYGSMMLHAESCHIDNALSSFSRFCSLSRSVQGDAVSHYRAGLITNVEMMNIITKLGDFIDQAVPEYLAQVLVEKCKCYHS